MLMVKIKILYTIQFKCYEASWSDDDSPTASSAKTVFALYYKKQQFHHLMLVQTCVIRCVKCSEIENYLTDRVLPDHIVTTRW